MAIDLKTPFAKKGLEIYQRNHSDLEANHYGKFIAIEVESGGYCIGECLEDAIDNAKREYPNQEYFMLRIGPLATVSFGHQIHP